jgi:hypothetical protein
MTQSFLSNRHYAQYARLLYRLHGLIATGVGDSAEADEIRSQMAPSWTRLIGPERDALKDLSRQLHAFHSVETPELASV